MSTDRMSVRLVIIFLGLIALVALVGGLWLAHDGKTIPPELIAMGSGALGAVAGLLARTGSAEADAVQSPAQRLEQALAAAPPAATQFTYSTAPATDTLLPAVPVEPAPGA